MEQEFVKNNLGVQEQIALIKEGNSERIIAYIENPYTDQLSEAAQKELLLRGNEEEIQKYVNCYLWADSAEAMMVKKCSARLVRWYVWRYYPCEKAEAELVKHRGYFLLLVYMLNWRLRKIPERLLKKRNCLMLAFLTIFTRPVQRFRPIVR